MNPLFTALGAIFRPTDDSQVDQLAELLGVTAAKLRTLPENPRLGYRTFTIRKRHNCGRRTISAPTDELKRLQRKLLDDYLAQQPVHYAATAFRRGGSIARHAGFHMGQTVLLSVDVKDFFPSTSAGRVRDWYQAQGWSGCALNVLMRLSVYREGLPQGAPTSPALSNLVNYDLDQNLNELCGRYRGRYSRYADDLAFSWAGDFEPAFFQLQVTNILHRHGYAIQPAKGWRRQPLAHGAELAGVVIQGSRLRPTDTVRQRIGELRAGWRRKTPRERKRLAGYMGFLKMLKR